MCWVIALSGIDFWNCLSRLRRQSLESAPDQKRTSNMIAKQCCGGKLPPANMRLNPHLTTLASF